MPWSMLIKAYPFFYIDLYINTSNTKIFKGLYRQIMFAFSLNLLPEKQPFKPKQYHLSCIFSNITFIMHLQPLYTMSV
jgi:hypothetical protein